MESPAVFLIGGAPGAGKTTLGRALAARLDATSLTADDLLTAVRAVTTPRSHPGLHVMSRVDPIEYFTTTPVDQLAADADLQHEAAWPAIEMVVRKHATWGPRVVIDGWFLRPAKVAALQLEGVASAWISVAPSVLERRERENMDFFGRSDDPERMLRNFLGRSLWFNELVSRQAADLGLGVLEQDGSASVEALCSAALTHA